MIHKYSDLQVSIKKQIKKLSSEEFGNEEVIRNNVWSTPDWCNFLVEGGNLISFHLLMERTISIDELEYKCAGLSNVITVKEARGKGHATRQLKETTEFIFSNLNCDLGLLLCGKNMIPFYANLGWTELTCMVAYQQPEGTRLWNSECMILTNKEIHSPKRINLNGLPW